MALTTILKIKGFYFDLMSKEENYNDMGITYSLQIKYRRTRHIH